jgi:hypothetical protein
MFRTRIELKQIGVRDEAKRLDGIGRCGRQYCSASWLPELRPVNLGVAKDQRLSLNPSQISGACGRLMCCLRYEHEFYVQSRRKYPKEAKAVRTSRGEEKVIANDIFRERVTLRGMVDGELRTLSLADLLAEMAAAGDPLAGSLESASRHVERELAPDDLDEPMNLDLAITEEYPVPPSARPPRAPQQARAARPASPSRPPRAPAPAATAATLPPAAAPEGDTAPAPEPGAEGEKRTQRRRGRRGGRRNRPGGGAPPGSGAPPAGPAANGA